MYKEKQVIFALHLVNGNTKGDTFNLLDTQHWKVFSNTLCVLLSFAFAVLPIKILHHDRNIFYKLKMLIKYISSGSFPAITCSDDDSN